MATIKKKEQVYQILLALEKKGKDGVSAGDISEIIDSNRANISRYLNQLCRDNRLEKINGRPVLYKPLVSQNNDGNLRYTDKGSLDKIVGANGSLCQQIEQAKAAILYPPRGIHTLVLGETGVGKSMFADLMHTFAIESGTIKKNAPFIQFNCADYADNPQLLMSQIFGVKKGAYTGANYNREGLLKKADKGIFFLDEVHRLTPQGQEMLFTFIDKGYFRPLGETEKKVTADVQLIAATTENPQSYLLSTFIRRIPMTITLPSLGARGIEDRFFLLENFFKKESKRIGKKIYINKNSLISFLLYDCPNNIGQLNSDIQLACARAFLTYKTESKEYLMISQPDLPGHVKKGLMKLHNKRSEIELLLQNKGEILEFSYDEKPTNVNKKTESFTDDKHFYDIIEDKLDSLRSDDMDEEKIREILNIDIESHFKKHLEKLSAIIKKDEIRNVVEEEIVDIVEEILRLASDKLQRSFDKKIFYGLALHLQKSIERIKSGETIFHPELNNIRVNYYEEFMAAMEGAALIDRKFNIETPFDEIGYISMFLVKNPYKPVSKKKGRVVVIVLMHGSSTASSMVKVANDLLGIEYTLGIDMPLNISPEKVYDYTLQEVNKLDPGVDVLLLVDMGSLTNFADMIAGETGRLVKTIDMVSTAMVIDATRKAVLGQGLIEIYNSCCKINSDNSKVINRDMDKENVIISFCFTGEGASEKLREIIKEKVETDNFKVITLNIINRDLFMKTLIEYTNHYNILALVGTVDINIDDIPFISAVDILSGEGISKLTNIIHNTEIYNKIKKSLKEHITDLDSDNLVDEVRNVIKTIEKKLKLSVSKEVKIGIMLHICFLIQKLVRGGEETEFQDLLSFINKYEDKIDKVRTSLSSIEKKYSIVVGENELAYISNMFLKNKE